MGRRQLHRRDMSATSLARVLEADRAELLTQPPQDSHLVRFYEDDEVLGRSVCEFLGAGLRSDETLIAIASEKHLGLFQEGLSDAGFDLAPALRAGSLTLLDARET